MLPADLGSNVAKILRILFMIGVPLKVLSPSQRFFSNAKKANITVAGAFLSPTTFPSDYPFRHGLSSQSCEDKTLLGLKLLYSKAGTEPYRLRDAKVGQISSGRF